MNIRTEGPTLPRAQMAWIAGAAVTGFVSSAVFAGTLGLSRNAFLLPHGIAVAIFLWSYVRRSRIDAIGHLYERPWAGVLGALVAGAVVISNVLSQPASDSPEGGALLISVLWVGVVYGLLDALLLSVVPVVAAWLALDELGLTTTPTGRGMTAGLALVASSIVTAAYHWGYPEFRGSQIVGPVIGNAILTGAYLLTKSPISPLLAHVGMHIAAVLHGMETTIQLPPHG